MIVKLENRKNAQKIFGEWPEMLITSCLQGVMGDIYADNSEAPRSAMALLGDFCFLAGAPDAELASYKPDTCTNDFMIMIPPNEAWEDVILSCYGEKARRVTRYAIRKEKDIFDKEKLEQAAGSLAPGYTMKMMDQEAYDQCLAADWSRDLVSQYADYERYRRIGLGVVVYHEGILAAGASSYASYQEGIEIEIDTHPEHRRRGLAFACGARLVLECLKRGWYPSWDAQNTMSVGLAQKLGYHFDHAYTAFEIQGY